MEEARGSYLKVWATGSPLVALGMTCLLNRTASGLDAQKRVPPFDPEHRRHDPGGSHAESPARAEGRASALKVGAKTR